MPNVHLEEREGEGKIKFIWSFRTYDVTETGLYQILFFVMCLTFGFSRGSDIYRITVHVLASRLRDSRISKSRVLRCYGERLYDRPVLSVAKWGYRTTLQNEVPTYCTVTTAVSHAGTTAGCSHCRVCTLVS